MNTYKDWKCPECEESLVRVGIIEVYHNVEEWTKYTVDTELKRWDVVDNGSDDGSSASLECGACHKDIPESMHEEMYNEIFK